MSVFLTIIIPYDKYNTDYNVITITELEDLGWPHCYSGIIFPLAISQDLPEKWSGNCWTSEVANLQCWVQLLIGPMVS